MSTKSAPFLVISVAGLIVLGIVMLSSTGAYTGVEREDIYYDVKKQARWMALALCCCVFFAFFNYRHLTKLAPWLYGLGCILLILCYIPSVGLRINGASRWISAAALNFPSLRLQPSEFARIAVVIAVAAWFAHRWNRGRQRTFLRGVLAPLAILALPMALIVFEKDIGATALLGAVGLGVMFIAGTRWFYIAGLVAAGAAGIWYAIVTIPNRMARFVAFLDLEAYKLEEGLQQWRSLIALATGGIWGVGLGNGRQKMLNLPAAHTDFIFPMVGEELGLVGTLLVVAAFATIATCGMAIAFNAADRFGQLLAFGIVALIVSQAIINIGVTTALLPNKGTPLPFVSYGGSNLLAYMSALGILLSIYRHSAHLHTKPNHALARAKITPRI